MRVNLTRLAILIVMGAFPGALSVQAQPDTLWTRTLRDAGGSPETIRTFDGGFAIAGSYYQGLEGRRDVDFGIVKTDSICRLEWHGCYEGMPNGRHQNDYAKSLRQLPDGGYILAGDGGGGGTGMMVRTDSTGGMIWTTYLPREEGLYNIDACELAENDHFIVASWSMAAEVDGDGEVVWFRHYDGVARINRVIRSDDGCFLLVGSGSGDMKAVKIGGEGEIEWRRTYATENADYGMGGIRTSDGGYCLVGTSHFGLGDNLHSMIVRIDPDGEVIWQRVYSEFQHGDFLEDVVETADGGFAAAGHGQGDYYLLRIDSEGEPLWRTYFGDHGTERCCSLILMEDNGYLLGGFSSGDGAWLIRTEPDPVNQDVVELIDPAWISHYELLPPYPNPFNQQAHIEFALPTESFVNLTVYGVDGRVVDNIIESRLEAGHHRTFWQGLGIPAGLYILKMEASGQVKTRKMVMIK